MVPKLSNQKNLTSDVIMNKLIMHRNEMRKYRVKKIGLFGSYVKGRAHKGSDLDFLVKFDKPTFDNYIELKFLLEKIFHKKVDLVIEDNLKPALKHVKEEAVYAKGV